MDTIGGPRVMARHRQQGKSTEALTWVREGTQIDSYPGWSRALVVDSVQTELALRSLHVPHTEATWWSVLEDWSHRVFVLGDLVSRPPNGQWHSTEIVIDELLRCMSYNAEMVHRLFHYYKVYGVTMSGDPW